MSIGNIQFSEDALAAIIAEEAKKIEHVRSIAVSLNEDGEGAYSFDVSVSLSTHKKIVAVAQSVQEAAVSALSAMADLDGARVNVFIKSVSA